MMAASEKVSRRQVLLISLPAAASVPALVLLGCKRPEFTCSDTSELAEAELNARAGLGYVDRSPDPAKTCETCHQYEPAPAEGQCGGCKIISGPIHPLGYCDVFAANQ